MASAYQEKKDFGSTASQFGQKAHDGASDAANKAKDVASNVGQKAQSVASDVGNAAKDMASNVSQKVGDAASFVGKKAEDAACAVGSGMKSLGGTVRDHVPSSGMAGTAGGAIADTLESSGRYLQEHGISGIGNDITHLIRRNPIPAMLIGVGAGFLLARAVSRNA